MRYVPTGQETQELDAVVAVYFPAPQTKQPDPFEEEYPTGQEVQEFDEKHEKPAAHETVQVPEQALAAVVALNLPAPQITQSASSSCKDAIEASSLRYIPASQDVQADKDRDL